MRWAIRTTSQNPARLVTLTEREINHTALRGGVAEPFPAWPLLLGAIIAAGLGFTFLVPSTMLGIILLAVAGLLVIFGIRQGQRGVRAAGGGPVSPQDKETSAPMPLETRTKSTGDYTDEAAVREAQKAKRRCKECGSPVLEGATECPTCGSDL